MKTCLDCMTTTNDNSQKVCAKCGGSNFRAGRPKTKASTEKATVDIASKPKVNVTENKQAVRSYDKRSREVRYDFDNFGNNVGGSGETMQNNAMFNGNVEPDVSLGSWILNLIIMAVPVVNIIYVIIRMATYKMASKTMLNYFKASLIVIIVGAILSFLLSGVLTGYVMNYIYTIY